MVPATFVDNLTRAVRRDASVDFESIHKHIERQVRSPNTNYQIEASVRVEPELELTVSPKHRPFHRACSLPRKVWDHAAPVLR